MTTSTDVPKPIDRSTWGAGPWDGEPDRVDFHTAGYPCLLHRGPAGAWCGYVAVPPGHPLHGIDYDGVHGLMPELDVHGGLTYAAACRGGICHVPAPGEPDDVWWLGFDCGHAGDVAPRFSSPVGGMFFARDGGDVYRDEAYAAQETQRLALQIAAWTEARLRAAAVPR